MTDMIYTPQQIAEAEAAIDRHMAAMEAWRKRKLRADLIKDVSKRLNRSEFWQSEEGHVVFRTEYDESLFEGSKYPSPAKVVREYFAGRVVDDVPGLFEDEHVFIVWADDVSHNEEDINRLFEDEEEAEDEAEQEEVFLEYLA